jgi:hypothetical protein
MVMDREWMYKTSRLHHSYLEHVTKFIAVVKRHCLGLKREHTVCPCKSYKNILLYEDNVVKSHLVQFHREVEDPSACASRGNSSTTTMAAVNAEQQTTLALAGRHGNATTSDNNNADRDYITMDDLLQDTADDDGGGGSDDGDGGEPVRDPETVDLFESIANCLDHDNVLFGGPSWLENFREMKQATIDLLYKDCPKHWIALRFNL